MTRGVAATRNPTMEKPSMPEKLSVQLWGMSADAEGRLAIAAIVVIVLIVAILTVVAKRRI